MKEVFKISYTINYNIYAILALPFRLGAKSIALGKVEEFLSKICHSKRSSFTNRDFGVKIAMIMGG